MDMYVCDGVGVVEEANGWRVVVNRLKRRSWLLDEASAINPPPSPFAYSFSDLGRISVIVVVVIDRSRVHVHMPMSYRASKGTP